MNENALLYEYSILRYVPSIERGEFINVGLMMMCKRRRWLRTAITVSRERIMILDPVADLATIERQLSMFSTTSPALADLPVEERFRWFSAVKSASIQTSRPHPGLIPCDDGTNTAAEILDAEFDRLYSILIL